MSTKPKSILELAEELQRDNEELAPLKRAFSQSCKAIYGYNMDELHTVIKEYKILKNKATAEARTTTYSSQTSTTSQNQ